MDLENFNLQALYGQMPLWKRISLFLKTNHYLVWKITLMDVTILVPLFTIIGLTLEKVTRIGFFYSLIVSLFVCSVIEYYRIKLRRLKTCRYIAEKIAESEELVRQIAEAVERSGTDEDKRWVADMMEKLNYSKNFVALMTDVVFKEDVIGFSDEDEAELE